MSVRGKISNKVIEEAISRGGEVVADKVKDKAEWVVSSLRIKKSMLEDIDKALQETVGISRTGWILQAIQEKLKRNDE